MSQSASFFIIHMILVQITRELAGINSELIKQCDAQEVGDVPW